MDWTRGYVADIGYTAGFYREMSPSHMAFAALTLGRSPGRAMRPKRVLELGFGQGFGLTLLAAANPDVTFEGHDFNPEHVAHARRLIEDAKLANLTVSESSFEEAAARGDTDDLDVIALHGIFSWVSRAAQDAIVAIIRQRLQPDGVLYISYNSMPGWAALAPIRQFMLEVKRRNAGRSERQLALALEAISKLKQGGAAYFVANPAAAQHVDHMLTLDRVYLAHEYLDEHWDLFQFSEVAARLGEAKLSFVASATLPENLDQYALPGPLHALMHETDDPVMRETLRDYAGNKRFRRDIFARGLAAITSAEHRRMLSDLSFALCVPRNRVAFKFLGPLMELIGRDDLYGPIVDRLAEKSATLDQLVALPPFGDGKVGILLDCLCLLVHSGQVAPVIASESIDKEPAQRFNRMIVDFARTGRIYGALASPVLRSGIPVRDLGMLALAALFDGKGDDPAMAAKHALSILQVLGRRPMKDGVLIEDDGDAMAFLIANFQTILDDDVPVWRQLGMI
jgi:SAM-dependent methyltransferase